MKSPHAIAIVVILAVAAGCGGGNGPSSTTTTVPPTSTTTSTTTTAASTSTTTVGPSGVITIQNAPCVADASGPVTCTFVGSASGFTGTPTFAWTFVVPTGTRAAQAGPTARPELGCNFSTGVATFQIDVTLVITSGTQTFTVAGLQQITRKQGACNT